MNNTTQLAEKLPEGLAKRLKSKNNQKEKDEIIMHFDGIIYVNFVTLKRRE